MMKYLCLQSLILFSLFVFFFFLKGNQRIFVKAENTAAASSSTKSNCAVQQERLEIQLKNAEIRASNSESELKVFKQNHEISMQACTAASERQTADLDRCKNQNIELGEKFNTAQDEKLKLLKQIYELQSKQVKEQDPNKEVKKFKEEALIANKRILDLEILEKVLKQKIDEISLENKKIKIELDKKKAELKNQKSSERVSAVHDGATNCDSESTHIFSKVILLRSISSVYDFYRTFTMYMISFVPEEFWISANNSYIRAKATVAEYMKVVHPYVDTISTIGENQYNSFCSFYQNHLSSIVNKQVEFVATVILNAGASARNHFDKINKHFDVKLENYFVAYPEMRSKIPESFVDRIFCLIFVVIILFLFIKFGYFTLKYIVLSVIFFVVMGCRKRRLIKSNKTQKSNKKFIPMAYPANAKKYKETSNTNPTPLRKINA